VTVVQIHFPFKDERSENVTCTITGKVRLKIYCFSISCMQTSNKLNTIIRCISSRSIAIYY